MDEKRTSGIWTGVLMLVALPLLYVGSFLALLKPSEPFLEPSKGNFILRKAEYRFGGAFSHAVFQPLLKVDWRIRPTFWCDLSERGKGKRR